MKSEYLTVDEFIEMLKSMGNKPEPECDECGEVDYPTELFKLSREVEDSRVASLLRGAANYIVELEDQLESQYE
jgi:hypothetical protein